MNNVSFFQSELKRYNHLLHRAKVWNIRGCEGGDKSGNAHPNTDIWGQDDEDVWEHENDEILPVIDKESTEPGWKNATHYGEKAKDKGINSLYKDELIDYDDDGNEQNSSRFIQPKLSFTSTSSSVSSSKTTPSNANSQASRVYHSRASRALLSSNKP